MFSCWERCTALHSVQLLGFLVQEKTALSVLLLVLLAFVCGTVGGVGEGGGVAAALQVVKQFVSRGELVVAGHTVQDDFALGHEEGHSITMMH